MLEIMELKPKGFMLWYFWELLASYWGIHCVLTLFMVYFLNEVIHNIFKLGIWRGEFSIMLSSIRKDYFVWLILFLYSMFIIGVFNLLKLTSVLVAQSPGYFPDPGVKLFLQILVIYSSKYSKDLKENECSIVLSIHWNEF